MPSHAIDPEWEAAYETWREENGPLSIDENKYLKELYDPAPPKRLERLPTRMFWRKRGNLKDCSYFKSHFVVGPRVKALIEELDPGVHGFYPVEMVRESSGETWPEPFYLLHIRHVLDSVVDVWPIRRGPSRGNWSPSVKSKAGLWSFIGPPRLTFDRKVVAGKHVWRDVGNLGWKFGSTRFVDELERRGIKGISAREIGELSGSDGK